MSWQEELRKLDEELAAGQISADEYRVRRDNVLASAVSVGPESKATPPADPAAPASQGATPQSPAPQAPAPPAQQPGDPAKGGEDADQTQVVPAESERTQAVGRWQVANPSGPDADRTQAVPGVPPQAYAGGMAPRPAPGQPHQGPFPPAPGYHSGWHEEVGPQWSGADFPPLAASGSPEWIRQGPEVFEETARSRRGTVAAIVAAVLVVVLVGVGIWWFVSRDDETGGNPPVAGTSSRPAPPTSSGPPRPLAGVEGQVDDSASGSITVAQAAEKHQFSPDEAAILGECKARDGQTQVLYQESWFTLTHVFRCGDIASRDAAVTKLREQQKAYGFTEISGPKNLPAMILENATDVPDAPVDVRVFYASGDSVVRVEVRGHNRVAVEDGLSEVLGATTRNFPVK